MKLTEFDPLATCPPDRRQKYRKRAILAEHGGFRAAIELKCLECCGWDRPEVKRCVIMSCALWGISRRIFGVDEAALGAPSTSTRVEEETAA